MATTDTKAEIRDGFCDLANLLQNYASELTEEIPWLIKQGETKESDERYNRAKHCMAQSEEVLTMFKRWRDAEFPVPLHDEQRGLPPTVKELAHGLVAIAPVKTRAALRIAPELITSRREYRRELLITLYGDGGTMTAYELKRETLRRMGPRLTKCDNEVITNKVLRCVRTIDSTLRNMEDMIQLHGSGRSVMAQLTPAGLKAAEEAISDSSR